MGKKIKSFLSLVKTGKKIYYLIILGIIMAVIVIAACIMLLGKGKKENKLEVLTESGLQKIINISEISTFEAVYNGVAKQTEPEKPDKVLYYVAYEAIIKAGFDIQKLDISMNNDTKTIHVTLPEIIITEVDVDEKSLDYMFVKDSLNEAGISGEAYNLCIADVKEESERESTLYELAKENAVKTVKALLVPLIEQMDSEYAVEVQ